MKAAGPIIMGGFVAAIVAGGLCLAAGGRFEVAAALALSAAMLGIVAGGAAALHSWRKDRERPRGSV